MPFNFETFDKRSGRYAKAPEVTIQSKGAVSLNAAAARLLGDADAVEMLYDKEQQVVGIRPVPSQTAHAYPMRAVGPQGGTFVIACKAFFAYYGVPLGQPVRREVTMDNGVLILDLKDPGRVAIANRKRAETNGSDSTGARWPGSAPVTERQSEARLRLDSRRR